MKKRRIQAMCICVFAYLPVAASAGLITEHWTSTITGFSSDITGLSAGDTFDWRVIFDNTSRRMTRSSDGPDGVAHTADDYLDYDWCLSGAVDGCVFNTAALAPAYVMLADATFDLSGLSYGISGLESYRDVYGHNSERAYTHSSGAELREFWYDSQEFKAYAYTRYYYDSAGASRVAEIRFDSQLVPDTVPIPSPLALIGVGMIVLGTFRRKSKTKYRTNKRPVES